MSDSTELKAAIVPHARPLGPAATYKHDHPPIQNVNALVHSKRSLGQQVADKIASVVGGWPFIITQSFILGVWIISNVYLALHYKEKAFDPYPFILLNLVLSFQAAYTGPIVMMSQNRQNEKDRMSAQSDFECNLKAEEEIRVIMDHLTHQDQSRDQGRRPQAPGHLAGHLVDDPQQQPQSQDEDRTYQAEVPPRFGGVRHLVVGDRAYVDGVATEDLHRQPVTVRPVHGLPLAFARCLTPASTPLRYPNVTVGAPGDMPWFVPIRCPSHPATLQEEP